MCKAALRYHAHIKNYLLYSLRGTISGPLPYTEITNLKLLIPKEAEIKIGRERKGGKDLGREGRREREQCGKANIQ